MAVQAAGVAALRSWEEFLPGNVAAFRTRRDAAVDAFRAAGFECEVPKATRSKAPIAIGGSTAQRNGVRRAQAETSKSQA